MGPRIWSLARWVGTAVGALGVVALVAGTSYQFLQNRSDLREHPAPGQLVDAGGHRLHVWCTGEGSPVVVLEAGLGGSSLEWSLVQPEVATTTRVCSYDRAGMGWSDIGPNPRTAAQIVSELHTVLQAARIPGPYVLAGHSSGGLNVRLYASTYPADTAGLVLVDAAHEDQWQRMPPEAGAGADNPFVLHLHSFLTVVGFARVTGIQFVRTPQFGPEARRLSSGVRVRTTWPFAYASESLAAEESMTQVRHTRRGIPDVPLVVISRGRYDAMRRLLSEQQAQIKSVWESMQADLVELSSRGVHVVADASDPLHSSRTT